MATQYTHILHFSNTEAMDHAEHGLSTFTPILSSEVEEFDGDEPYELFFTTSKPLPQTTIQKFLKYITTPTNHTFNQH